MSDTDDTTDGTKATNRVDSCAEKADCKLQEVLRSPKEEEQHAQIYDVTTKQMCELLKKASNMNEILKRRTPMDEILKIC